MHCHVCSLCTPCLYPHSTSGAPPLESRPGEQACLISGFPHPAGAHVPRPGHITLHYTCVQTSCHNRVSLCNQPYNDINKCVHRHKKQPHSTITRRGKSGVLIPCGHAALAYSQTKLSCIVWRTRQHLSGVYCEGNNNRTSTVTGSGLTA